MDACQKHLMLPWMKGIGGSGRGTGRAGAVLKTLHLFLCCVRWAFWNKVAAFLKHGKSS